MAMSVNGMITKDRDDTDWVSDIEWKNFSGMIRKNRNMIIGRRTYDIMMQNNEFKRSNLDEVETVVLTNNVKFKIHDMKHVRLAQTPEDALEILKSRGFQTIMICGGGGANTSFIKKGLVDELYIDIEPYLIGKGIPLFRPEVFNVKLMLVETKKISKNTLQLHYKIIE